MSPWLRDARATLMVVAAMVRASTSYGQDRWHEVAAVNGRTVALDTSTISRTPEGYLLVWLRHQFKRAQAKPSGLRYSKMLALMLFDCQRQRGRRIEVVYYDSGGNIISRSNKPGAWGTVPDALGALTLFRTCQYASSRFEPHR
jgi:hypothetical protein